MGGPALPPAEVQFLERLREHPQLWERFQNILELTRSAEGPVLRADAVEERLIQELRQLGLTSMNEWAKRAELRVGEDLKGQDATVRSRKKKR
jgi:hypothetical protein